MPFVSRRSLVAIVLLSTSAAALALGFLWSGLYDVGADDPHLPPVHAALDTLRENSIAARAKALVVPDLSDPVLLRQGAGNYDAMCRGCHLAPGATPTELSRGLYPSPPNFSQRRTGSAAHHFWVIKHGIKASGMPAWGKSMDDRAMWGLVAFVQRLPALDAAQYRALVAGSEGHSHGGTAGGEASGQHPPDGDHPDQAAESSAEDSAVLAVVDGFGDALVKGDLARAKALLDPRVLILESGGAEQSRDEYLSHHAPADAAFLRGAQLHPERRRVRVEGASAWVGSESEIHARQNGKLITLRSTETMVLRRQKGAWHITHIHWSSAPAG